MKSRIHVSLTVANLTESIEFYQILFGTKPSKRRDDYAKFEPADPSVNLSLNPGDAPAASRVSHFGVEVASPHDVRAAEARLRAAGLITANEDAVTCCYAVQDKVWIKDPDGNAWEIFCVTQKDTTTHSVRQSGASQSCCPTENAAGCC